MFYECNKCGMTVKNVYKAYRKVSEGFGCDRRCSALSLRLSGQSTFEFQNKSLTVGAGDIVYIPAGIDYYIRDDEVELIVTHLHVFGQNDDTISVIHTKIPELFSELFEQMHLEWQSKREGYEYRCTSILYSIFTELDRKEGLRTSNDYNLIKPGVVYMREKFFSHDISIAKLAGMCNLSEVYFRKLFKNEYGITPLREINRLRLNLAKSLLESGCYTIAETAEKSGFSDPHNFSTFFKKETGKTPSDYLKRIIK